MNWIYDLLLLNLIIGGLRFTHSLATYSCDDNNLEINSERISGLFSLGVYHLSMLNRPMRATPASMS